MLALAPPPSTEIALDLEWAAFLREQEGAPAPGAIEPKAWRAFLDDELRRSERGAGAPVLRDGVSTEGDWQSFLGALSAELGPDVVAVLREGVNRLRGSLDREGLLDALRSGIPLSAEAAITWTALASALSAGVGDVPGLPLTLERFFSEAGLEVARGLDLAEVLDLDALYARAQTWASRHGANQVQRITENTRLAVRAVLAEAFEQGRSVEETARALSEVLGLDARRAVALDRYIQKLLDDSDLSAAQIQHRIDQRFGKLLRQRGNTVARTELWTAGNVGQLETWREAAAQGLIDIRGLGKVFVSDLGEIAAAPTLHPRCFCTVRLVRVQQAGIVYYVREWVVAPRNPCARCLAFKGKRAA